MYRRVLVPLDGSRLAEGILPFVLQIAGPLDLEVVLVRVVEPIMTQTLEGTGHAPVDDVAARLRDARQYLAPVAEDLRSRGVRVTTDARHGEPLAELLAAARDSRADLIAMTPQRPRPAPVRLDRGSGAAPGTDPGAHDATHEAAGRRPRGGLMAPRRAPGTHPDDAVDLIHDSLRAEED